MMNNNEAMRHRKANLIAVDTKYEIKVMILLCLCLCGCSDGGIQNTLRNLSAPSADITNVPIEIQELLWDNREYLVEKLSVVQQDDTQPDWVSEVYRTKIRRVDQQRLYYTKYIDADGIAIMGNAFVTDAEFLIARDIVLRMTTKRPEMRKLLSPAGGYRIILVPFFESTLEVPEKIFSGATVDVSTGGRFMSVNLIGTQKLPGSAYAIDHWGTLVHEFAHSMHAVIQCYERNEKYRLCYREVGVPLETLDFQSRLETAYAQALNLGVWKRCYAETNHKEYWAEGVQRWYYDIGPGRKFQTHEAFAAYDPLLAELLQEWFDKGSFRRGPQFLPSDSAQSVLGRVTGGCILWEEDED